MSKQVVLPLEKLPAAHHTISLSQIPLGAYGDQFQTQWVLFPIQPKSYFPTHFAPLLMCTRQCGIRPSFPLDFLGNQPSKVWGKNNSIPNLSHCAVI